MKLEELKTIEQLSQFLDGTRAVIFKLDTIKKKRYQWIRHELVRFDYMRINKADKGVMKTVSNQGYQLLQSTSYTPHQAVQQHRLYQT